MPPIADADDEASDTDRWPGPLAAVDMGSNSFRLEIGQVVGSRYRRIEYLKETVRLGAGLDADGMLGEEASARGLACLDRFARRLEGLQPSQVRAVATQTLREARNRDLFLARAQQALGVPIEVISGREEARLIYAGVARLQPSAVPRLVIDIGGRSTEMILGKGAKPVHAESFQVGSVSLSMRYFPDGRYTEQGFREAQVAAGAELEEGLEPFAARHWREALGSSGTVGAVSQVLAASGIDDGRITPAGLRWLMEQCLRAGHMDRLLLPGLKDERRAVLGGGLAILYTLSAQFGIVALQPARGALRQGVIFDLDERRRAAAAEPRGHDMREASVRALQRRFGADAAQAERVARIAERLYESARPAAPREARRELQWASALHEVGMMVSHHDHHRHSAYLLAHVDAPGFSQSQLRRVAALVLGQRGGLRKVEMHLAGEEYPWQVLALRIAAILAHARAATEPAVVDLRAEGQVARLGLEPRWAERNPRTLHLLVAEVDAWSRTGRLALVLETVGQPRRRQAA
ncbi:MAG TPA: Ppx/GppA phosphatase family protein [Caldimonas sp.]|nr:Ppx/GppA phosphatase family protein [Caldimonas sp.]